MFCSCDLLLFFHVLVFESEERRPVGHLPGCRNVAQFYNADQRGLYLYPLHFEWRKSANFAPISRRLRHFRDMLISIRQTATPVFDRAAITGVLSCYVYCFLVYFSLFFCL